MTEPTEYQASRTKSGMRVLLKWYEMNAATGTLGWAAGGIPVLSRSQEKSCELTRGKR